VTPKLVVPGGKAVKSFAVASLLAPFIIAGAVLVPASAEPLRPEVAGLPQFEIVAMLRSAGFEPLARPVRGAGVFFVRALDPYDDDVRLTVDARSGRIMAVRSMSVAPVYGPPAYRGYPDVHRRAFGDGAGFEDATGALPVPPRAVPGGGSTFGHRSTLPLPRPRPSQAMAAPSASPTPAAAAPKPADAAPASDKPAAAAPGGVELPPVTPLE
jgi:hypothetical protein